MSAVEHTHMAIVPDKPSSKISFFTAHVSRWAEDPAGIGTTPQRVANVQEKLDEARDALIARQRAIDTARSATLRLKNALAALGEAGAQVIGEVKAKAAVEGNAVFHRALLPERAKGSPLGAPGKATSLSAELGGNGALHLSWKCKQPRGAKGTMYQVYRQLGAVGDYVFLGATGKKKFLDATLPAGNHRVVYRIVAVRSTARGQSADFIVTMGVSGKMPAQFLPRDQYNAAAA
jgi:hypothetical protein